METMYLWAESIFFFFVFILSSRKSVCWFCCVLSAECVPALESDYLNLWSENMIVVKKCHKNLLEHWTMYDVW